MNRLCPVPGCGRPLSGKLFMCSTDWAPLPRDLKRRVYRATGVLVALAHPHTEAARVERVAALEKYRAAVQEAIAAASRRNSLVHNRKRRLRGNEEQRTF
jgi:hypothetical protein